MSPHNARMHSQSQWHTVSVFIEGANQPMLDKNACIGRNARIVASEAPSSDWDFGEVLVRDGIPCVRKGARVQDGWRFPAK